MKRSKIFIIALLSVLLLYPSCNDEFLDVENVNNLTEGSFYQTPNDFILALNSCYTPLVGRGMHGLNFNFIFGTWSDRILFEPGGESRDYLRNVNSGIDQVGYIYQDLYFGLYRTTALLKELNESGNDVDFTPGQKVQIEAEAKALRGAYYFYLVTIFHKPPFYNNESFPDDYTQNYSNGEPVQFWDQLTEDLSFATKNLPVKGGYGAEDVGRITSGGASAMLGKAMLHKYYHYYAANGNKDSQQAIDDLTLARDELKKVIDAPEYDLVYPKAPKSRKDYIYALLSNFSYVDIVTENNTYPAENNIESVWELQFDDGRFNNGWLPGAQWSGSMNEMWFGVHLSSYKNWEMHPDIFYEFETTGAPAGFDRDPRAYATCYIDGDTMDFREGTPYFRAYNPILFSKQSASKRADVELYPGQPTIAFAPKKYNFPMYAEAGTQAPNNSPVNRRIIRYSDVLLMYAEVMYLLGDDGTGADALNEVRARVDMPPIASLTSEAIIHERDIEFAGESLRFHDLVRWSFHPTWNINWADYHGLNEFKVGKNEYLPIPRTEIDVNNGALKQNPGW